LGRVDQTAQYVAAFAAGVLFTRCFNNLEAFHSVKSAVFVFESERALGYYTETTPRTICGLEILSDDLLSRRVAALSNYRGINRFQFSFAGRELIADFCEALHNLNWFKAGHDARFAEVFNYPAKGAVSDYGTNMSWAEKSVYVGIFAGK
jgi:hypothetical protein